MATGGGSAAGVRAGRAFVTIEAIDRTGAIMAQISKRMSNFAARMNRIGRTALFGGLFAALPAGGVLRMFSSFDDAMRKVEARSRGTNDEMAELRFQAAELGRTTSFTATQVGELQARLARLGFSRQQIKAMTGDVLSLARAAGEGGQAGGGMPGEADTVLAAQLVGQLLRSFKLEATETQRVADVLTAGVNSSALSLESLADSFKYVGPVAELFHMSLEETVAVLGQLANLGIDASMSGTALRGIFVSLSDTAKRDKFGAMLKEVSGRTVEMVDAARNLRPLPQLLFEIGDAIGDLGTAKQFEVLAALFSNRQIVAGAALGDVREQFGDLLEIMQRAAGTGERTSKLMDAGLGGTLRILLSAVEGVSLAIGDGLDRVLQGLMVPLTAVTTALARWLEKHPLVVNAVAASIVALLAFGSGTIAAALVVKVFAVALGMLGSVCSLVTGTLALLVSVLGFLVTPLGLVLVGIGAATAAFLYFSSTARAAVASAGATISTSLSQIASVAGETWAGIVAAFEASRLDLAARIMWDGVQIAFFTGTDAILTLWDSFVNTLLNTWTYLEARVSTIALHLWYGLREIFSQGFHALDSMLQDLAEFYIDAFGWMLGIIGLDAHELFDEKIAEWERTREPPKDFDAERDAAIRDVERGESSTYLRRDEEMRRRAAARQARIDGLRADMSEARAAVNAPGAGYGLDTAGALAIADAIARNVPRQAAKDDQKPTPGLTASGGLAASREALVGLEKGSVEAAKAAIEGFDDKMLTEAQKQSDLLAQIVTNTADGDEWEEV